MLLWITSGSGTHTIDFTTYSVQANQLYFISPGQIHNWELTEGTDGYAVFFEGSYFSSRFGNRLHDYPFFNSTLVQPLIEFSEVNHVRALFTMLFEAFGNSEPNLEVNLSLLHLILESSFTKKNELADSDTSINKKYLQGFEDLLHAFYKEHKSVGFYAEKLHVSPNHLNAICRKSYNKTASGIINEKILIEAQRLLINTSLSIKELCYELGFENSSYFNRFFKKHLRITPQQFRSAN